MTRLNLVPPEELADQHLFAEFRELKMVPRSLARTLYSGLRQQFVDPVAYALHKVPPEYVLGTGHVSFFYDKGTYLARRYSLLRQELARRGVNFDQAAPWDASGVFDQDARLRNDYTPTPAALALVRERIQSRLAMRPAWYRWTPKQGAGA